MKRVLIVAACIATGIALAMSGPQYSAVGAYSSSSPGTSPSGSPSASPSGSPDASPSSSPGDILPPDTEITSGPTGSTRKRTPTFEFESTEEPSFFECSVDSAEFSPCDSPFKTNRLSIGGHNFRVRAIDDSGNIDPTPASQDFKVKKKEKKKKKGKPGRFRPGRR